MALIYIIYKIKQGVESISAPCFFLYAKQSDFYKKCITIENRIHL